MGEKRASSEHHSAQTDIRDCMVLRACVGRGGGVAAIDQIVRTGTDRRVTSILAVRAAG